MMTKLLHYSSMDSRGEPGSDIIRPRETRTKTASLVMTSEMADFWKTQTPDSDKYIYLLVNIMGASEFWGSNLNGDLFAEKALKQYHKTFMQGHNYLLHDNNDVKKSFGKIIFATYNDDMHRVENICRLLRSDGRTQNIEKEIGKGLFPEVSMGCHVPNDRCTICDNIAKTKAEYCIHVKKNMRQLWPIGSSDGRRVGVWNDHPTFFDNSYVQVPADPQSGVLAKIASLQDERPYIILSVDEAEGHVDKAAANKLSTNKAADMDKPLDTSGIKPPSVEFNEEARDAAKALDRASAPLGESDLDKLSHYPARSVIHTAALMGISIKPEEYGYMRAKAAGVLTYGSELLRRGAERHEITASYDRFAKVAFNRDIARILEPHVGDRSFFPSTFDKKSFVTPRENTASMPSEWRRSYAEIVKEAMAALSQDPSLLHKTAWVNVFIKTACKGEALSNEDWEGVPKKEASVVVEMLNGAFGVKDN